MIFDPFKDFEARGYLRNFDGEKDSGKMKLIDHASFLAKLDSTLRHISRIERFISMRSRASWTGRARGISTAT